MDDPAADDAAMDDPVGDPVVEAWTALVDGLRAAGERVAADTADLDPASRADAYRALVRGLHNQLARFEVDRDRPELVEFNGWRQKMFMDNPDFRYRVASVRDDRRYRIAGTVGDAAYLSITAYVSGGGLEAAAASRIDLDSLHVDDEGRFEVTLSRDEPTGGGDWLPLPEGASAVWVRHFHRDVDRDRPGGCTIEPLDEVDPPPAIDTARFARHLARLGRSIEAIPAVVAAAVADDLARPNRVRPWSEMAGGAAFTEPGIRYLRGSWRLAPDEALVIEGEPPPCRYWNVLLYSRVLNSLDHRHRPVSRTDGTTRLIDGRYRFVLAADDPGGPGDWLDTEGRDVGLFVFRFLHPTADPALPTVRVVPMSELDA